MITRPDAERIAAAIHALRPDWPIGSIVTLIGRDLTHWAYLDLVLALAHVAAERDHTGQPISVTPARVKEDGPWRTGRHSTTHDPERARQQRLSESRARQASVDACDLCDHTGRLPTGHLCIHDTEAAERARRGAALARAQLAAAKAARPTPPSDETPNEGTDAA